MTDEGDAVDQQAKTTKEGAEPPVAVGEEVAELSEEERKMAALKEAIIVDKAEVGPLRLKLTVTVPRELVDERMGEQFDELKRDALVPGFRKGRAPMRLVEKRFATDVGKQLKGQLISSGYLAAVEKEELKPLGDPLFLTSLTEERVDENQTMKQVEVEKLLPLDEALVHFKLPKEGPLSFACEFELKPEFDLPKLDGIPVKRPTPSISEDDVDRELTYRLSLRGTYKPVEKGPVATDDMLYVDMKMRVGGEIIESEENYNIHARSTSIQGVALPTLGEVIVGKKIGEVVTCEAPVPDDYDNVDIRGQNASFEFKIHEIKRLDIPPIDDTFLSSLGFDTEQELRDTLRASMEAELGQSIKQSMHEQIGQYLLDNTKVDIPEGLSQRQSERTLQRRTIDLLQRGMPEAELHKHIDELRTQARDQVSRDLKLFFIIEKIAEEKELEVSEEQLNTAIAQIARRSNKRFDRVRDELTQGGGLSALYLKLRDGQILDTLLSEATVTDVVASPKKSAASAKKGKKTTAKKTTKKTATAATAATTSAKKAATASAKKKVASKAVKKAPKQMVKKAKKKS